MATSAATALPPALAPMTAAGWAAGALVRCRYPRAFVAELTFRIDHRDGTVLAAVRRRFPDVLEGMKPYPIAAQAEGGGACLFVDLLARKPTFYAFVPPDGLERIATTPERFASLLRAASAPARPAAPAKTAKTAKPAKKAPAAKPAVPAPAADDAGAVPGYAASSLLAGVAEEQRDLQDPAKTCGAAAGAPYAILRAIPAQGAKGASTYSLARITDPKGVVDGLLDAEEPWLDQSRALAGMWPAKAFTWQGERSVRQRQVLCNDLLSCGLGLLVSAWLRARLEPLFAGQAEFLPVEIRAENQRTVLHRDFFYLHPLAALAALDAAKAKARFERNGSIDTTATRTLAIDPATVPAGTRIFQLAGYGSQCLVVAQAVIPALLALPVPGLRLLAADRYPANGLVDWAKAT